MKRGTARLTGSEGKGKGTGREGMGRQVAKGWGWEYETTTNQPTISSPSRDFWGNWWWLSVFL